MGDDPKTGIKTDLSPGVAKWMKALSGAGKMNEEQAQKFLDLVWDGKIKGVSVPGKAPPMYIKRVLPPEENDEEEDIFEVEYQTSPDKPSVKISGTLEEIRAQLTKTD